MPPGMLPAFTEVGLVNQLTQWRTQIEGHLTEQATSYSGTKTMVERIAEDNQRLDQRLDGVEATATARIDDVVAKGITTLQATIQEFTQQIEKDRYAMQVIHTSAQRGLEEVVGHATAKFQQMDEFQNQAKTDTQRLVEGFNSEVERGRAADATLRGEIQDLFRITKQKFDQLDNFLERR